MTPCNCREPHVRRRIVLTGGPGAGKTAVLEMIRHSFCEHVRILPEAASIVFGGGFPRGVGGDVAANAAQRAIFYLQRELETAADACDSAIVLCDRGTVDGAAYWPGIWASVGSTRDEQMDRYDVVIHLRTPTERDGYNHQNAQRIETPSEAAALDQSIAQAWEGHPHRFFVQASGDFLDKAGATLALLREALPECCRHHHVPLVDDRIEAA